MGRYTNKEMGEMIESLYGLLDHRDIVGYAAARNMRHLQDSAREYLDIRDELIMKYGNQVLDEFGNPTHRYAVDPASEEGKLYIQEISEYQDLAHEVEIYRIPASDTVGILSGREMLALDWMLSDGDAL